MNRSVVKSSYLHSVGYDAATKTLEIEFMRGGLVFQYAGVPPDEYQRMMQAQSAGRHFHKFIKRRFPAKSVPNDRVIEEKDIPL